MRSQRRSIDFDGAFGALSKQFGLWPPDRRFRTLILSGVRARLLFVHQRIHAGELLRARIEAHMSVMIRHSDRWINRLISAEAAVLAAALDREAALGRIPIEDRDLGRSELAGEMRRLSREMRAQRRTYWANLPRVH